MLKPVVGEVSAVVVSVYTPSMKGCLADTRVSGMAVPSKPKAPPHMVE